MFYERMLEEHKMLEKRIKELEIKAINLQMNQNGH